MPSEVVLGPVYAAVKALLAAYVPLTAALSVKPLGGPAIYDEGAVVQAATMPYLTIGAGTQNPDNRLASTVGHNCTFQIKVVGQISEAAGLAILSHVAAVLSDGRELTLAGYSSAWCEEFSVQPTIIEQLAGVTTRSWPVIVRVRAYD